MGFALLRSLIGPENSCHSLSQSQAKLTPITTWSPAFSRAFGEALVFTLSSHCLFLCSEWLSQLLWCLFDCQLKTALYKVK